METRIEHGCSLNVLKTLDDNSVDSVVTDPPYGLSFMNKHWDYDVPSIELWKEVLRVLKPGGHLLSFGGTRTYHRMVVNIEDAGFEIRDQIQWLYGSGFPKSHNISKAIDKKLGVEREVIGLKKYPDGQTYNGGAQSGRSGMMSEGKPRGPNLETAPATDQAKTWDGYGTALKPANEPIVLARKPLSEKTIVDNVLKWGVGGLNIDASRVSHKSEADRASATPQGKVIRNNFKPGENIKGKETNRPDTTKGRFPANIILDEDAARALDEQSGISSSNVRPPSNDTNTGNGRTHGKMLGIKTERGHKDKGGASRFFYVAKASKRERNAGLEGIKEKKCTSKQQNSSARYENGIATNKRPNEPSAQNHHPTVKPVKLMQYLVRLVTPPNGTVLDPFTGSGTTGIACKKEGFSFIGIEREAEYCEIAKKRINVIQYQSHG